MNLRDIQLQIIVAVQNMAAMQSLQGNLNGLNATQQTVAKTAGVVGATNWKQVSSWHQLSENVRIAEQRMDAVFRAGLRLQQLGQMITGFGMAGVGFFKGAADAFGDFEFMLTKVAASSGIYDKQSQIFGDLKEAIKDTSIELKFLPIDEVAEAFYHWSTTTGQTIETQEDLQTAIDGVTAASKTAIITQTSVEQAIKGAYAITKQYGLGLDAIPKVMAELHVETIRTSAEFDNLIESFKYLGPLAGALGLEFEDMTKIVGMLADTGQRGSMAGRGLAMFLTKIVKPTKDNKKAFNELMLETKGVSDAWSKMVFPNGEFVGLETLVLDLASATADLTQEERLNYITRIASTQNAARVILPLINQQIEAFKTGANIFNDPKYSVEGALEAWQTQWEMVGESWKGMTEELSRIVEVLTLSIGERVARVFTPIVAKASEFLKMLNEWVKANPKIMDVVVTIGTALSLVLVLLGGLLMVTGIGLVFYASMYLVGTALMTIFAPLAVLIGLVAALGVAFATNAGGIRDAVQRLVRVITDLYSPIFNSIDWFGLWQATAATAGGIIEDVATRIADAINELSDWLTRLATTEAGRATLQAVGEVLGFLVGMVPKILAFAGGIRLMGVAFGGFLILGRIAYPLLMFATGLGTLIGMAKTIGGTVTSLFALAGMLRTVALAFWAVALSPLGLVVGAIAAVGAIGFLAYENNWLGFRDVVDTVVTDVGNLVSDLAPKVQGALDDMSKAFDEQIMPALQGLAQVGVQLFVDYVNSVVSGAQTVADILGKMAQPLIDLVQKHLPAIQARVGEFVGKIAAFLGGLWDKVREVFDEHIAPALQRLGDTFKQVFDDIAGKIGPLLDAFLGFVSSLMDNVLIPLWNFLVRTLGPVFGWLLDVVGRAFEGILTVVGPILQGLIDLFGILFETIIGIVQGGMQILGSIFGGGLAILTDIFNFFSALFRLDFQGMLDAICQLARDVWDMIVGVFGGALTIIQSIIQGAVDIFTSIFQTGLDVISALWDGAFNFVKDVVTNVLTFILGLAQGVMNAISGIFESALQAIRDLVSGAFNFVRDTINGILNTIHDIIWGFFEGIVGFFGGNLDKVKLMVDAGFRHIQQVIHDTLNNISTFVSSILEKVAGFFREQFNNAKRIVDDIFTGIKNVIGGALDWIKTNIIDALGKVIDSITGFFGKAVTSGQNFVQNIINGIASFFQNLINAGADIVRKVIDGVTGIAGQLLDIGASIVRGIWDGIVGMAQWIIGKVRDFIVSIIPGPIRDILGIHSPSRVMAELGRYAMQGLADGLLANTSARKAMEEQVSDILAASRGIESATAAGMAFSGDGLTLVTENRRVIELNIEVTSSDGSVSQLDLSRLTRELEGSSLVEALEAAAAAD